MSLISQGIVKLIVILFLFSDMGPKHNVERCQYPYEHWIYLLYWLILNFAVTELTVNKSGTWYKFMSVYFTLVTTESFSLSQRLLPQRLPATIFPPIYVGIMKKRKKNPKFSFRMKNKRQMLARVVSLSPLYKYPFPFFLILYFPHLEKSSLVIQFLDKSSISIYQLVQLLDINSCSGLDGTLEENEAKDLSRYF